METVIISLAEISAEEIQAITTGSVPSIEYWYKSQNGVDILISFQK